MAKYHKKPIVVEAEQFHYNKKPWHKAIKEARGTTLGFMTSDILQYINTLEGCHIVRDGDWIITGIKGEKYPCKPDIFELTYELVEE